MDGVNLGHAASLWVGLHLLLLLVLSALVVRQRQKHKILLGDEGVPQVAQAVRAFGNATEYVPAGLAGLIVLDVASQSPLLVHIAGAILFAGRVIHAVGLSTSGGASIARSIGMTLTWLAYVFLIAATLFTAIV
ncbi:MAPEG family protein [Caulobacter mirabilis]|uniref:Glutathione S-transferase n=1 Tax=Caulobacter mirabilis TaxID=69666 RepID=A0A2D2AUF6_9CAUL|nr:MAPEG family protein [Caulobacter mirabilis]ATQ41652.1 glutathione S-transferase [Caulobacter mirabilis]